MADGKQRPGVSGLALAAAVCSIVTLQALAADFVFHLSGASGALWGCWWGSVLIIGPGVLGIAAALRIALSRGKLAGWGLCLLGVITTLLGLVATVYAWAAAMSMLASSTAH